MTDRKPPSCAAVGIGPARHPGGQRPATGNAADSNAARDPALGSGSVTEPQRSAVACQVTPTCSLKCPSLSSNRPPPARCTIQASRMMTRMIRTIQITVTTKPGSTNLPTLATVATLAAAHAFPEDLGINVEGPKSADPQHG